MPTSASIPAKQKNSPFSLRITQTSKGCFWDVIDKVTGERRFIIDTKVAGTRQLAEWILENVQ